MEATALMDRAQELLTQARETQCKARLPVRCDGELLWYPQCPLDEGHEGEHRYAAWVPSRLKAEGVEVVHGAG